MSGEISVLLIEDDEDDYFLTVDLFEMIDTRRFVVTWADNVESGITELQSGKHDICLIDYRLGPVTGVEVLESCREALRSTPAMYGVRLQCSIQSSFVYRICFKGRFGKQTLQKRARH